MIRNHTILSSIAAALLLSGTAFAADLQPAAGEAPFANTPATTSLLQRADVRSDAIAHAPVAGNLPVMQAAASQSALTRAQVRAETREAIAHGFRVESGNLL